MVAIPGRWISKRPELPMLRVWCVGLADTIVSFALLSKRQAMVCSGTDMLVGGNARTAESNEPKAVKSILSVPDVKFAIVSNLAALEPATDELAKALFSWASESRFAPNRPMMVSLQLLPLMPVSVLPALSAFGALLLSGV